MSIEQQVHEESDGAGHPPVRPEDDAAVRNIMQGLFPVQGLMPGAARPSRRACIKGSPETDQRTVEQRLADVRRLQDEIDAQG
ncbi:MAG: hypothetical protein Q7S29_00335 [Candidatus Peribacter sp.]|nr:hypothetical protein [Candidatus Peribacter sp.]